MTPHEIDLLMHYYTCVDEHRDAHLVGDTLCELAANGFLERLPQPTGYGSNWKITERGEVYCVALTRVPLPVQRWVMPDKEQS